MDRAERRRFQRQSNLTPLQQKMAPQMLIVAQMYLERPNDPYFKQFSPAALQGIKETAKGLLTAQVKRGLDGK